MLGARRSEARVSIENQVQSLQDTSCFVEPRSSIGEGHRWLLDHVERGERRVFHLYGSEQEL